MTLFPVLCLCVQPLRSLHLSEIKSDLFHQAEVGNGELLTSESVSVSPASSASAGCIGPLPSDQPSQEESGSSTR